jgi:hypothetical protein
MKKFDFVTVLIGAVCHGFWGCGKGSEPATAVIIQGKVMVQEDSSGISGANVVLFDAKANTPIARVLTTVQGTFSFTTTPGSYYLTAGAQGRISSPPPNGGKPLPFQANAGGSNIHDLYLELDGSAAGTGGITGKVNLAGTMPSSGILIIATTSASAYSTTTGPDGVFIFFNLNPGSYTLQAFKAGLAQDSSSVPVTVAAGAVAANVQVGMAASAGKILRGKISFVASPNSIVDITLVNPRTRAAIPGLSTKNEGGNTFTLSGIPAGTYLAWASFHNDGYVMDPDRIQKFGLPEVSFLPADTAKALDFEVTGAITILSPTDPEGLLYPLAVSSLTPTFTWNKYSSAKEYIVEVFNGSGKRIWGGFTDVGIIRHPQVMGESATFNFDGSASEPLKAGGIYSWKVYADNSSNLNIQGLISSSEDLRGIFQVLP